MTKEEIFDSAIRSAGDRAGVFEYDGETGYFYLYDNNNAVGRKVIGSIRVLSGDADFTENDVAVRWDREERKVGLFIREVLWAVFDLCDGARYGGGYTPRSRPSLPREVESGFVVPS
jgi:hypothetical protein